MTLQLSEEILERISYICKKYYSKGASPADIISALSAQFFNILLELSNEGEEEFVLDEFLKVLTLMKKQIIEEKNGLYNLNAPGVH